ncbi:hypothetical protein E2553_33245 [Paraburkholderia dipogonis]|uniref:Uncharacterized protein n=1 Tax=Paraburkholderia dipogonis TaxID=1211383 RepID=A0A4Y8MVF5_9BURK|nr:hypothetical protein [Paraburkholderia dipogonis]TFE41530.1 hypothetical protein E2553_33245 [Paraburkholderia dipogonis]
MRNSAAFVDLGYREDPPEDPPEDNVYPFPGSVAVAAHLSHTPRTMPRAAPAPATPTGDAALDRIYQILSERKATRRGAVASPRRFEACI